MSKDRGSVIRAGLIIVACLFPALSCKTAGSQASQGKDAGASASAASYRAVARGQLSVVSPAYVTATPGQLYISSFPFPNRVRMVTPADLLAGKSANVRDLVSSVTWPNKVVPSATSANLILPGGFLPPFQIGSISIYDGASTKKITTNKFTSGAYWFYHKAIEQDFNGDGKMDLLVARALKPLLPGFASQGELLWLENPGAGSTAPWVEHHLIDGPDVNFLSANLDGGDSGDPRKNAIIAAQFFSKKLMVYWWQADGTMGSATIDASISSPFDLQLVDLNNDGAKELLVTSHDSNPSAAGVFAYEIPQDFRHQPWPKHTLLTNIATTHSGTNQAAPGAALAFRPNLKDTTSKPWIVVAGDGAERVFLLAPTQTPWIYTTSFPMEEAFGPSVAPSAMHSTIGGIEVADLDGDGYQEIIVPAYDAGKILTFSLMPTTP